MHGWVPWRPEAQVRGWGARGNRKADSYLETGIIGGRLLVTSAIAPGPRALEGQEKLRNDLSESRA